MATKRQAAKEFLLRQVESICLKPEDAFVDIEYSMSEKYFGIGAFYIEKGNSKDTFVRTNTA